VAIADFLAENLSGLEETNHSMLLHTQDLCSPQSLHPLQLWERPLLGGVRSPSLRVRVPLEL
jgi:hypothetical protein